MVRTSIALAFVATAGCGARTGLDLAPPVPVPPHHARIAAGEDHSCYVDGVGDVWCWGHNLTGELGDGTHAQRVTPVRVDGLHGVEQIVATADRTCARTSLGRVYCWGSDPESWLGASGPNDDCGPALTCRFHPTLIDGLDRVVDVATSELITCVVRDDGGVWCWGDDSHLALGPDNACTDTDASLPACVRPRRVGGIPPAVRVSTANWSACALTAQGAVFCWGASTGLADPTSASSLCPFRDTSGAIRGCRATPEAIPMVRPVVDLGTGSNPCAVRDDGTVACWGTDETGWLGPDDYVCGFTDAMGGIDGFACPRAPVTLAGVTNAVSAAGCDGWLGCVLARDATVVCWNEPVTLGPLRFQFDVPARAVAGLDHVVEVSANRAHACALRDDESVWCWGANDVGELGNGSTASVPSAIPTRVHF